MDRWVWCNEDLLLAFSHIHEANVLRSIFAKSWVGEETSCREVGGFNRWVRSFLLEMGKRGVKSSAFFF